MNDMTIFNHLGNDIRVMTDEQGEPSSSSKTSATLLESSTLGMFPPASTKT